MTEENKITTEQVTSDDKIKTEQTPLPKEYGGRKDGMEPTRYGDWENNGRCTDF